MDTQTTNISETKDIELSSVKIEESSSKMQTEFDTVIGDMPLLPPNCDSFSDIIKICNSGEILSNCCCNFLWGMVPIIGWIKLCCSYYLIQDHEIAFIRDNGKTKVLGPGFYSITGCFQEFILREDLVSINSAPLILDNISIIMIRNGEIGFAWNNGKPVILLNGLHVYTDPGFRFEYSVKLNVHQCEFGTFKMFNVKGGSVQIMYDKGKIIPFEKGRYFLNNDTFTYGEVVDTTINTHKFREHQVLLEGGVGMKIEGLLTYQIFDPAQMIQNLGSFTELEKVLEQITTAELSRIFSSVRLEEVASITKTASVHLNDEQKKFFLGDRDELSLEGLDEDDFTRTKICHNVISEIRRIISNWGVRVVNFQLESTKIADRDYAKEYEQSSLKLSKVQADHLALTTENEISLEKTKARINNERIQTEYENQIVISKAQAQAQAMQIKAEAEAGCRRIEAKSRNDAATIMTENFAREFALANNKVEFAAALKAQVLTVIPESDLGSPIAQNPIFNKAKLMIDN